MKAMMKISGIFFIFFIIFSFCKCSDGGSGSPGDAAPDVNLTNIVVSQGKLSPSFNDTTIYYTVEVNYEISEIVITPSADNPDIKIKINDISLDADKLSASIPLVSGENIINIVLTVGDGKDDVKSEKIYTIAVTRLSPGTNADLDELSLSHGILSPVFRPDKNNYGVEVDHDINSITVMPTVAGYNATVTVNAKPVTSGTSSHSININRGKNTIPVVVTAQDGETTKSYNLEVYRLNSQDSSTNTDLVALTLSDSTLSPAFDTDVLSYNANVNNDVFSITVAAIPAGVGATVIINDNPSVYGTASVNLDEGENTISVRIAAGDGETTKTYTVVVTRIPSAPNHVLLTTGNPGQLSLRWAEVKGATAYEVWYNYSNDYTTAVKWRSNITETRNIITGLASGDLYYVWVKAMNAAGTGGFSPEASGVPVNFDIPAVPGRQVSVLNGSTSFNMNCANNLNTITFPIQVPFYGGTSTGTIDRKFYISETEVTNSVMIEVLNWALDNGKLSNSTGKHNSVDSNTVRFGSRVLLDLTGCAISFDGSGVFSVFYGLEDYPVIDVSWHGAIMFCNWLTEMRDGNTFNVVYSGITETWSHEDTVEDPGKSGYRLPSSNEWEFSARYLGSTEPFTGGNLDTEYISLGHNDNSISGKLTPDYYWTPGDYASGAADDSTFAESTGLVAWYNLNSSPSPHKVMQKLSNTLGLYDMSGNVREWCFNKIPSFSSRSIRSGSYNDRAELVEVGETHISTNSETAGNKYTGFRFVRSVR